MFKDYIKYKPTSKDVLSYYGVSLVLCGVPYGMYMNYFFPIISWSPIFMFLSVVSIISFKNVLSGKLPLWNSTFTLILFFQLMMLFYGIYSSNMTEQYLSFHLYILFLTFALSSQSTQIDFDRILIILFIFSSINTLLGLYFSSKGMVTGILAYELRNSTDNFSIEAFTVSSGVLVNLIVSLYLMLTKKKIFFFVTFFFVLLDFYVLIVSTKRTPIFLSLLIATVFLHTFVKRNKRNISNIFFVLFFMFCFIYIVLFQNENFTNRLIDFFEDFVNGLMVLLGDSVYSDKSGSAIMRVTARDWTFNLISNDFRFFNYLYGYGYMTKWIDNPILQSYLDMGILGIISYVYLIVIFPLMTYLKYNRFPIILVFILLTFYNIFSSLHSGHPYSYIKYTPILLLSFVITSLKKQIFVKREKTKCDTK